METGIARKIWRNLWPERRVEDVPITHITNGVHTGTWLARRMRHLFDRYLGNTWMEHLDDPQVWEGIENIPDAELWTVQGEGIAGLAPDAVAIGETGLDFYRNLASREHQIVAFRQQIALALELGKPIVVHCRDAFSEIFEIIEETGIGPRSILHCWTGGPRWTKRFLTLGVMFSFAGPVAFETGDTVRLGAAEVPPERAMVETDTPYLAPPPHRGEPNEPGWVALVGAALAGVWGMAVEEVATITSANATRVFRG